MQTPVLERDDEPTLLEKVDGKTVLDSGALIKVVPQELVITLKKAGGTLRYAKTVEVELYVEQYKSKQTVAINVTW